MQHPGSLASTCTQLGPCQAHLAPSASEMKMPVPSELSANPEGLERVTVDAGPSSVPG